MRRRHISHCWNRCQHMSVQSLLWCCQGGNACCSLGCRRGMRSFRLCNGNYRNRCSSESGQSWVLYRIRPSLLALKSKIVAVSSQHHQRLDENPELLDCRRWIMKFGKKGERLITSGAFRFASLRNCGNASKNEGVSSKPFWVILISVLNLTILKDYWL